ncbi:MAG: MATE family efflux transporter [Pseudomonadota bacterium]
MIATPMTLAFLSTPLLGLVDTAVIGQLGSAALLGGLAIGAILFNLVDTPFNFLRSSTAGFTAQALGADDAKEQHAIFLRSLMIAIVCGLFLITLIQPLLTIGLPLMGAKGEVAQATRTYVEIRMLGAPLALINFAILGWLLGLGRAGTGLFVQTVLNSINIILSIYLGLHLEMGIAGVAWATVAAQAVAALLGIGIFLHLTRAKPRPNRAQIFDVQRMVRLMVVNRDIMIRSFILMFAFAFFTAQGARYGETTLAANAILMQFFMIAGYFLNGLATAAEQLVGRAIGANYRPAFDRAVRLTLILGFVLAGLASTSFYLGGPWLIDSLTTNDAVRAEARIYLIWAAATAVVGVLAFHMDGVFIGATWSVDMRNMMFLSLIAYITTWFVLSPWFGNHGLWFALEVFLGARGLSLYSRIPKKVAGAFTPQG